MADRGVKSMPFQRVSETSQKWEWDLPRFWLMDHRRRTTSNGLVRSTRHWCCRCGPRCANVCHHWDPRAKLWCLCHRMCTMNRLEKRWRCSSNRCDPCGWSWVCSWPSSRPWRYDPNRMTRWLGWCGLVRSERMTPNRSDPHLGWCICIRPMCSTTWWSCHVSQTRFDDCQHWMQLTKHPIDRMREWRNETD